MTLRKSLQTLVATLVLLSFAAVSFAAEVPAGVVNINTADAGQLANLPRVGAKAAQRIIAYRNEHGAFKKPTDLMQVKGFGEKSLARLAPYITVEGKTTLASKVKSPRKPRTAKASNAHLNTAG